MIFPLQSHLWKDAHCLGLVMSPLHLALLEGPLLLSWSVFWWDILHHVIMVVESAQGHGSQNFWVLILTVKVTLAKLLNLSIPQFIKWKQQYLPHPFHWGVLRLELCMLVKRFENLR